MRLKKEGLRGDKNQKLLNVVKFLREDYRLFFCLESYRFFQLKNSTLFAKKIEKSKVQGAMDFKWANLVRSYRCGTDVFFLAHAAQEWYAQIHVFEPAPGITLDKAVANMRDDQLKSLFSHLGYATVCSFIEDLTNILKDRELTYSQIPNHGDYNYANMFLDTKDDQKIITFIDYASFYNSKFSGANFPSFGQLVERINILSAPLDSGDKYIDNERYTIKDLKRKYEEKIQWPRNSIDDLCELFYRVCPEGGQKEISVGNLLESYIDGFTLRLSQILLPQEEDRPLLQFRMTTTDKYMGFYSWESFREYFYKQLIEWIPQARVVECLPRTGKKIFFKIFSSLRTLNEDGKGLKDFDESQIKQEKPQDIDIKPSYMQSPEKPKVKRKLPPSMQRAVDEEGKGEDD